MIPTTPISQPLIGAPDPTFILKILVEFVFVSYNVNLLFSTNHHLYLTPKTEPTLISYKTLVY